MRYSRSRKSANVPAIRVIQRPFTRPSWLLGCTAIVAGVFAGGMVMSPGTAIAAGFCGSADFFDCVGVVNEPVTVTAGASSFQVEIGDGPSFVSNVTQNNTGHAPALLIDANGQSTMGDGIHMFAGSSIYNYDFVDNETGVGLEIRNPGALVNAFIDGGDGEDTAASIIGTTGLLVDGGSGAVHLVNNGHIEGKSGSGIAVDGQGEDGLAFILDNHSYGSTIGSVDGLFIHNDLLSAQVNNNNGLIAGLTRDGINVSDVNGDGSGPAVSINNGNVGIIVGQTTGININQVVTNSGGADAIDINNGVFYDVVNGAPHFNSGGLIYGDDFAGIAIEGSDGVFVGGVNINNGGTRGAFVNPATLGLDAAVFDSDLSNHGPLINSLIAPDGANIGGMMPLGIYGQDIGIIIGGVTGDVNINNSAHSQDTAYGNTQPENITGITDNSVGGAIIGGGFGVVLGDFFGDGPINGHVNVDNSNNGVFVNGNIGGTGGFIGGLTEDGIAITNVGNNINVNNNGGTVYGLESGVFLADTYDAEVNNAAGQIIGWDNQGVHIEDTYGAHVSNGLFDKSGASQGGVILAYQQAVYLGGYDNFVGNGAGGAILGSGFQDSFDLFDSAPVIELHSPGGFGSSVDNYGLISSYAYNEDGGVFLPHFDWRSPYSISFNGTSVVEDPGYSLDVAAIASDVHTFGNFAWSGGQAGSLDSNGTSLVDYGFASRQLAITSTGFDSSGPFDFGGGVDIANEASGILIGRVETFTDSGNSNLTNFGVWYVSDGFFDPESILAAPSAPAAGMVSEDGTNINNAGLVQTAFSGPDQERATFYVGNVFNGSYWDPSLNGGDGGQATAPGLISAIDGGVGDAIVVAGMFGFDEANFTGAPGDSFVGLDVNLGPGTAEDPLLDNWNAPAQWRADRFFVDGYLHGSTGLILNKVNTQTTNAVGDTIIVAHANEVGDSGEPGCADVICKDGDPLYIASQSSGYVNVNGTGVIQDGLYGWYLHHVDTVPDPDYILVSDWAPADVHLPALTTGAQNISNEIAGQVEDHIYGQHFPAAGEGGSGADLPVDQTPVADPVQAGGTPAVWAKVTGDRFARNTTVAQTIGGITTNFDTSLVQSTFALLGGADYQPSGVGNDGLRFGVFGAYINSGVTFTSYGASANYNGGAIGAYAAYTSQGFYVDGEAKLDVLDMTYSSGGLSSHALATTVSMLANAGYRMQLGASFVEPIVSASYANTNIQNLTMGGATVAFSSGQSFRVGVGGKVGTDLAINDQMSAELALTAKIWDEFGPNNVVTVSDGLGNSNTFSDGISGVFGEVAATATVYNQDKSMSAFASLGDKFNSSFNSISGKAGFRKSF